MEKNSVLCSLPSLLASAGTDQKGLGVDNTDFLTYKNIFWQNWIIIDMKVELESQNVYVCVCVYVCMSANFGAA